MSIIKDIIIIAVAEIACFGISIGLTALNKRIVDGMKSDVEKWNRAGAGKQILYTIVGFFVFAFDILRVLFPVCFVVSAFGSKAFAIIAVISSAIIVFRSLFFSHYAEMESAISYGKRSGAIVGAHIILQVICNFIFLFSLTTIKVSFPGSDFAADIITLILDGIVLILNIVFCVSAIKTSR